MTSTVNRLCAQLLVPCVLFSATAAFSIDRRPGGGTQPPHIGEPGDNPSPRPRPNPAPVPAPQPAPVPAPTPTPATPLIEYKVIDSKNVALTVHDANIEAAKITPEMKLAADKLLKGYKDSEAAWKAAVDATNNDGGGPLEHSLAFEYADYERTKTNLQNEIQFFDDILFVTKGFGLISLSAGVSYLADQMRQQLGGIPQARVAIVLSTVAAGLSQAGIKAIEDKQKDLRNQLAQIDEELNRHNALIYYNADHGGDTTIPLAVPTCLYKTTCVTSRVCTRNGLFGEESCADTKTCKDELLSCRND